ncbi:Imm21 family immunity protein [Kitasatospora sp. NPDC087861]|uniref:Imm21 family immunity protein n=1 Tax=Kitasatospora sp. NPDC087861 TaxID=3364070 RepID=UPI00381A1422
MAGPPRPRGAGRAGGRRTRLTRPAAPGTTTGPARLSWQAAGPADLFDAAWTGGESAAEGRLRLALPAGRHRVRAAHVEPAPETWRVLVRLELPGGGRR